MFAEGISIYFVKFTILGLFIGKNCNIKDFVNDASRLVFESLLNLNCDNPFNPVSKVHRIFSV